MIRAKLNCDGGLASKNEGATSQYKVYGLYENQLQKLLSSKHTQNGTKYPPNID